ncbi:GNAT family N-acetyltransferase [Novosphingobium mangrovi (ex Huang et al. 2023)]|uniref:GNAT family N-acetyltransferase n=1 Tax=Novosphingobium mangrovi (ex Huang et al. 2023) TaxID=2976432 RepID=A0ABT2I5V2_9SPHN|nr:GNAT family N-acetyltransferase [Novosphingobium mangrovi (ex Huang et al. 2023)]MCT2399973.1 GNAT family N-acetyltransferase [Novosphingobium mangrovi (ex Huang et al. 2023)]
MMKAKAPLEGFEGNVVKIEYHSDLKEVQSDGQLARLLSDSCQHAPFDRLAWWQMLERHCGLSPLMAIARDADRAAILPLAGTSGHLSALANWYTFRFRPVISGEPAPLTALARDLARKAHRVTLSGIPDEDGSASLLQSAFRTSGWLVLRETCDTNHILPVAGRSYDEYIASRPGKLRTTLKRKTGKVETQVLTHFDEAVWAAYEDIYAESWKPEEGSPDFLRAFARAEGDAGRLRLGVARAGGEAIAAQMWTVEGGTAFIHKLAHREAARPLSPGSVLTAALFRHVIDVDKVDLVDFGTGDDPYKRDWMEQVRPRYRLDMFRPVTPRNWPVLAMAGMRRLAAIAKRG